MRSHWHFAWILALVLLGSCSTIDKLASEAEKWRDRYDEIHDKVAQVGAELKTIDKDNDGKVTLAELIAALTVLGGIIAGRNAVSNARKTKAEERIAKVEAKVGG